MSKTIYFLLIGITLAIVAVFVAIYQPNNNEDKNVLVPVVNEIVEAKPVKIEKKSVRKVISFGTIRVSPEGALVVAGKVYPNSLIEIILKGEVIAKTKSDKVGEFVIVPKKALRGGEHILAFRVTSKDNKVILTEQVIAIKVNENKSEIPIVAIINSKDRIGTKVIQAPGLEKRVYKNKLLKNQKLPSNLKPEISILTLTNDINLKQIILTGYAIDGIQVEARISGKEIFFGKIIDNEWSISIPNQLITGKQKLIADLVDKNGKLIATDYINLHGNVIKVADDKTIVVVQKGDALWKIAYQRLGGGDKYFDIIKLNQQKINNPNLIYPKQLFILPK